MGMFGRSTKAFLAVAVMVLLASAIPTSASAVPVWKFNGSSAGGTPEGTINHALESSFEFTGIKTTCEPFVYQMEIKNSGGTGIGIVTNVPLSNCFTDGVCTVDSITANGLTWPAKLTTVGPNHYIVISEVEFEIVYGNPLCALYETEIVIVGSAGARIDNPNESAVFDAASFSATGTELKVFGIPVAWSGAFRMIATGTHIGESLTVG